MALQPVMPAMEYESVNPFDGKAFKTFVEITDEQLEGKLATAQTRYETWRHKTYAERSAIVAKAGAIMHEKCDDFARLATLEMGKRIDEARGEVNFSANILTYYAKNAERLHGLRRRRGRPRDDDRGDQGPRSRSGMNVATSGSAADALRRRATNRRAPGSKINMPILLSCEICEDKITKLRKYFDMWSIVERGVPHYLYS